ncbi:hypothetical protein [Streptomyces sp. NPDC003943]
MTVRAAWLQSTGQTREDTRIALSALLTPSSGSATAPPLRSRPGIVPGGFALTGDSAMQCTIGTGRAVIQGNETAQGAYMIAVTAPESITIADGDPQYGRIDVIELAVLDDTYDKSGATDAVIRLIKGTPSATPQIPASGPGSSFPLYTISVPAGTSAGTGGIGWTTGAVTTKHYPMTALGGIMPASGFNGVYAGQYRDVSGQLQRWDGTAWVAYPKAIGGIAPNGTATTGSYAGQYRDNAGILQRWDGAAWQYAEGKATILFSVAQTSMQSVPPNAWTPITMNFLDVDDFNAWNGTDTFVVPRTGWWRVTANITWSGDSTTGVRGARITVNGGVGVPRMTWMTSASMGATSVGGEGLMKFNAGNTLQLAGYHNQTAAVRTLGGSGYYTSLTAQWIRS